MKLRQVYSDERAFIRVVELGSIRAAAKERSVEPSSISRRINALENRLGVKLLDRTGASSKITETGIYYYKAMAGLLAEIDALEAEIAGEADEPKGLLKVTASIDFGQTLVMPWIIEFQKQYQKVQVELNLSSEFEDLSMDKIDVGLRIGALKNSALIARRLASVPRTLVASKDYLSRHAAPSTPQELEGHDFVFFRERNRKRPLILTDKNGEEYRIQCDGKITVNAVNSIIRAVLAGYGLNMGPRWAYQKYIESGEIIELLPQLDLPSQPLYAIWKPSVVQPAKVKAFVDFVAEKAKDVAGLGP
ncbi:LysR family transcriptional regulator [Microbulbifer elongatus]|uniref:LysR family transcriptional regulator n=1 Tax=Microbulbifer elongatus TaxID=86173 RepID=A0ABT1P2C0_9GAMM|nr:LysR family transcriptional regulator [Microbulbifer elongatus]MCQ3830260.1 LysR family transcriptional regulator [Microbulbifer elongatus]